MKFGPEYSSQKGLTYDGWDVDKRILAELEWPVWEDTARQLQAALSDAVLEAAARRQPPEYFAKDGVRMIAALKSRREGLPEQARRFYRYINEHVDVFLTDAHERVEARRFDNGDLELSVRPASPADEPVGEPYFQRRFEAAVRPRRPGLSLRRQRQGGGDGWFPRRRAAARHRWGRRGRAR